MNMQPRRRLFVSSELSPVTPPPTPSRSRHYCGDVEPPRLAPIIRSHYDCFGAGYNQYRFPFDLSYQIMSEPEPITVHNNDVLMGRGGKNNQHSGNEKLRELAREQSANYRESTKKGKSAISRDLVIKMRQMNPPARFLKRNTTGEWEDVGDDVAREKASQVLRDAVALLPEEADTDDADTEPIAVNATELTAAPAVPPQVTQDEMDRKPLASTMGPPEHHHVTQHISSTSSFPPASPVAYASRKRQRPEYYTSDYAPNPYGHEPYPRYEGYMQETSSRRGRYDLPEPRYRYTDFREHDASYGRVQGYPYQHYYHTAPPLHYPSLRSSSTSSLDTPTRHHEYAQPIHQRPHSHPGYPRNTQHSSHQDAYLPQPPVAPGMYSPPRDLSARVDQQQTSQPLQQEQQRLYQQQQYSSPGQYHPHHQPPPSRTIGSSPIRRRPQAGDMFRQSSTASARSLFGDDVAANEFDLFNEELLASDNEHSPRQGYPHIHRSTSNDAHLSPTRYWSHGQHPPHLPESMESTPRQRNEQQPQIPPRVNSPRSPPTEE